MAVGKLIYDILGIYSGIIIASAIMSWLVAFGVINVRNQVIRVIVERLTPITSASSAAVIQRSVTKPSATPASSPVP